MDVVCFGRIRFEIRLQQISGDQERVGLVGLRPPERPGPLEAVHQKRVELHEGHAGVLEEGFQVPLVMAGGLEPYPFLLGRAQLVYYRQELVESGSVVGDGELLDHNVAGIVQDDAVVFVLRNVDSDYEHRSLPPYGYGRRVARGLPPS